MEEVLRLHGLGAVVEVRCTGTCADQLASAMRSAWSRCLVDEGSEVKGVGAREAAPIEARLEDAQRLSRVLMFTTQRITRALIDTGVGRLLMFHAGAVGNPLTGASLVYVAPGGTGKTTLSRLLGAQMGYVTDETVGVDEAGTILPYPKPLSVRRAGNDGLKDEVSPDVLGLLPAPAAAHVGCVVLLDRRPDARSAEVEEVAFMDALFALAEQTSSLSRLDRPLQRLGDVIDACGPVLRLLYAEAADIEPELVHILGGTK